MRLAKTGLAIAAFMIAASAIAVAFLNMDAHDAAKAAFPVAFVIMWVIFDRIKQAADKKYAERQARRRRQRNE